MAVINQVQGIVNEIVIFFFHLTKRAIIYSNFAMEKNNEPSFFFFSLSSFPSVQQLFPTFAKK